jgi:hypothetical protein
LISIISNNGCGSGENDKKLIFHVRVFQKPQNQFFIDQHKKLTNQTKIGAIAFMVPEYSQKSHFRQNRVFKTL